MASRKRKLLRAALDQAFSSRPTGVHPIISANAFAQATNVGGGASMNVKSGELEEFGKPGYFVGAEKSVRGMGGKIKTKYINRGGNQTRKSRPQMSAQDALVQRARVDKLTGGREGSTLGSWIDDEALHKGVQIDASKKFTDKDAAVKAMEDRGETALWDMGKGESVYNTKKKKK